MQATTPAATPAINPDPREQLDRLIETAKSMIFRRELEIALLNCAITSVSHSRMMKRSWIAPGEPSAGDVVAHHLKLLVKSLGGSAVVR